MKSNLALLEREVLPLPDAPEDTILLAETAMRVLDYRQLGWHLGIYDFGFRAALRKLGINPFTKKSVEAYKKQRAEEANSEAQEKYRVMKPRIRKWRFVHAFAVALGLGGSIGIPKLTDYLFPGIFAKGILGEVASILVAFPVGFGAVVLWMYASVHLKKARVSTVGGWQWETISIRNWWLPVPESILQQAVAIKERVPEAGIFVEHLANKERVTDPFLVVTPRGAEAKDVRDEDKTYVAVWEESKFESRPSRR